ncbi:small multidrug resistance protein [Paraburkholderia sp. MMS20-SJTR3]|uniref:Small multidrug resistance protein n=1 Tax=Paraburkholderia sejongensis TaxID=2886946 RepID=A0ABS8K694_9BURK|nr:EamA family transporter [Paraburkholderia sp. MMS20-SJTR3]MCC8397500.1 small multidrug resistance protein [Paraburkholderia sp. MMS20-SJTR3]
MSVVILIASGTLGGLASVLLRLAALKAATGLPNEWMPLLLRAAALCSYGVGFLLYALALRKANLGIAYPLMVAVSIFVVLTFTALHEHALKPTQLVGAVLILGGVWLVTR